MEKTFPYNAKINARFVVSLVLLLLLSWFMIHEAMTNTKGSTVFHHLIYLNSGETRVFDGFLAAVLLFMALSSVQSLFFAVTGAPSLVLAADAMLLPRRPWSKAKTLPYSSISAITIGLLGRKKMRSITLKYTQGQKTREIILLEYYSTKEDMSEIANLLRERTKLPLIQAKSQAQF